MHKIECAGRVLKRQFSSVIQLASKGASSMTCNGLVIAAACMLYCAIKKVTLAIVLGISWMHGGPVSIAGSGRVTTPPTDQPLSLEAISILFYHLASRDGNKWLGPSSVTMPFHSAAHGKIRGCHLVWVPGAIIPTATAPEDGAARQHCMPRWPLVYRLIEHAPGPRRGCNVLVNHYARFFAR